MKNRWNSTRVIAGVAVAALALAGCAGGAGGNSDEEQAGDEGYEYGASEEEIKAAFENVEPITITYQPSAQSPGGAEAYRAEAFIENLETLSDGKITVDTTYGQGIAGYDELPDALADGRVDIAYMLPIYLPDQFPVFQGYVAGTTLTGTSPLVDELAANAAMGELAWQDENLINEFRDQGIERSWSGSADVCGRNPNRRRLARESGACFLLGPHLAARSIECFSRLDGLHRDV